MSPLLANPKAYKARAVKSGKYRIDHSRDSELLGACAIVVGNPLTEEHAAIVTSQRFNKWEITQLLEISRDFQAIRVRQPCSTSNPDYCRKRAVSVSFFEILLTKGTLKKRAEDHRRRYMKSNHESDNWYALWRSLKREETRDPRDSTHYL